MCGGDRRLPGAGSETGDIFVGLFGLYRLAVGGTATTGLRQEGLVSQNDKCFDSHLFSGGGMLGRRPSIYNRDQGNLSL